MNRVLIASIHRNPPGSDVAFGAGEHVILHNITDTPADVSGWWIEDAVGHRLVLDGARVIPPRGELRVFVAGGPSSSISEFQGRRAAIINNARGEKLTLKDAVGSHIQTFRC